MHNKYDVQYQKWLVQYSENYHSSGSNQEDVVNANWRDRYNSITAIFQKCDRVEDRLLILPRPLASAPESANLRTGTF